MQQFLKQFKPPVRRGTTGRAKLLDGMLVLQLHWEELPDAGDLALAAIDADDGLSQGDMYWHVGYCCLSPYVPTFLELEWVEDHADGHGYELRSTWQAKTFHRAFETLDRSLRWGLRFYQLSDSIEPIASFDPSVVTVVEFPGDVRRTFWDPSAKKRGGRKPRAKAKDAPGGAADEEHAADGGDGGAPMALDDAEVSGDDEHDEDEVGEGMHEDEKEDKEAEAERIAEEFGLDHFLQ